MNERIKELASQVLDELVPETWTALKYDKIKEIQFRTAELIVRECLEELRYTVLDTQELRRDKSTDYQVGWEDGMFDAGETIKNIFGVEE
jgi:hypothetical protein